jgi:uncharacterized protein
MIHLEPTDSGIVFSVRAHAGARRNGITGIHDGALKVSVTQAAEKGKANKAIIDLLCDALDLRRAQLELMSGEASPQKRFIVREIDSREFQQRIAELLSGR